MYRAQLPRPGSSQCRVTRRVSIFWGLRMVPGRGGKGARSATALAASYSNYLSYRRFDFHAARPS